MCTAAVLSIVVLRESRKYYSPLVYINYTGDEVYTYMFKRRYWNQKDTEKDRKRHRAAKEQPQQAN